METILITEAGAAVSAIHIGEDLLRSPDLVDVMLPHRSSRRTAAIVTQAGAVGIAELVQRSVEATGISTAVHVAPDREAGKTLESAERCYLWLNSLELTRNDTVIGVGGGSVTDLAGFVAATYLRGVESIAVPTTLLASVDAAIGGKTGVNVGGKNLVGAFKHPATVIIDTVVLGALPTELIAEGAAEALKTGLIGDEVLVELYEAQGLAAPLPEVVRRAVAVKARIVSDDFRETASRLVLNYGHTIGHAIETVTGIPHGRAVAVGMSAAAYVSERQIGFSSRARHDRIIDSLGLPTTSPAVDPAEVMALVDLDKKRTGGDIRMVLLEDIGHPVVRVVPRATVHEALAAVGPS